MADERSELRSMIRSLRHCLLLVALGCAATQSAAQELEPYAYAHNPVGANFFLTAYGQTWGDILFDASSPLSDVNARWQSLALGYGQTFDAFGRLANFAIAVPYAWGDANGFLDGEPGSTSRSGFADPRFRLGINLIGGPALSPQAFALAKPRTTLGATLIVAPPLGEYLDDKLINLGSNRWSVKSELGLSHPWRKWRFELAVGAWWFTDNDQYLIDNTKEQERVVAYQLHIIYTFRQQLWVALDGTRYRGGEVAINGVSSGSVQRNVRLGVTASFPLPGRQSLKLSYSEGVATQLGGDFRQIAVAWQYTWF